MIVWQGDQGLNTVSHILIVWLRKAGDVFGAGRKSATEEGEREVSNPVNASGSGDKMVMTLREISVEGKVSRL